MRRTKIVATIGPASRSRQTVERLIAAGMNVASVNLSHGEPAEHAAVIGLLREAAARQGVPLAIMVDLPGPKMRIAELPGAIKLRAGQRVTLGQDADLPVTSPGLLAHLRPGDRVLIDDGAVELSVVSARSRRVTLLVGNPGAVTSHKGVNLPDTPLPIPAMTAHDRDLLHVALACNVDCVALSFVRTGADVRDLRDVLAEEGSRTLVVAKIEKREALDSIEQIITASDAVMVARGDLGVEMPPAEVPIWQKRIIASASRLGRPVVTATQMLQSMVSSPRPTRAEASDVANAIFDSTSAVMLSAETAVGSYPVEAVRTMVEIAETIEASIDYTNRPGYTSEGDQVSLSEAISYGACDVARKVGAAAIVSATVSGATARTVAKNRPAQPIIALSPDERVVRQLALCWGVTPLLCDEVGTFDEVVEGANRLVLERGLCQRGEVVVITAGTQAYRPGTTNLIKAHVLG